MSTNTDNVIPAAHSRASVNAAVRWIVACTVALAALAGVGLPQVQPAAAAAPGRAVTWTVLLGGQGEMQQQAMGPMGVWQFMRFYPDTITVNVGDTIVWKYNAAEPHTVTFPKSGDKMPDLAIPEGGNSQRMLFDPPVIFPQGGATYDGTALVGSGQMGGGPQFPTEFKLTFTKPGTYDYFCAFHVSMMKGKVVVQPAGTPYPMTQVQIDAAASAQIATDTQAALKVEAQLKASPVSTRPGPNGTTIYQVKIAYGDGMMAWMRFNPAQLTIKVGDSVEWVQQDVEDPHTVTFTSGSPDPDIVLPEPQQSGPPKLVLNPQLFGPAGAMTYSGKGYRCVGLSRG